MAKLKKDQRIVVIETAIVRLAKSEGIVAVTHSAVAKRCAVPTSMATVRFYFATKDDLWRVAVEQDTTGKVQEQAKELGWNAP